MGRKSAPKVAPKAKPKAKSQKLPPKQLFGQDIPAVGEDDLLAAPPRNLATQDSIRGDLYRLMNEKEVGGERMEQLIDSMQRAMIEESKAPGEGGAEPYRQAFQSLPTGKQNAIVKKAASMGADETQFRAFFGPQPRIVTDSPVDNLSPDKTAALTQANDLFGQYTRLEKEAATLGIENFHEHPVGSRLLGQLEALAEANPDIVDLIGNQDLSMQMATPERQLVPTSRDDFDPADRLSTYLGSKEAKRFYPEQRMDRRDTAKPNRRGIKQVNDIVAAGGTPKLPDFDDPQASINQYDNVIKTLQDSKAAGLDTSGIPVTVTAGTMGHPYEAWEAMAEMRPQADKVREHLFRLATESTPLVDEVGGGKMDLQQRLMSDLPMIPLDEYAPWHRAQLDLGNGQIVDWDADTLSRALMNTHFIGDDSMGLHPEGYDPAIRQALVPMLQQSLERLRGVPPSAQTPRAQEMWGQVFKPKPAGIAQLQQQLGIFADQKPSIRPQSVSLEALPADGVPLESLDSLPAETPMNMDAPAPVMPAGLPEADMTGLQDLINKNSMYRQRGPLLASLLA